MTGRKSGHGREFHSFLGSREETHGSRRHRRTRHPQGRQALHHRQGPVHGRHRLKDTTYGVFVRSPHAHAKIVSIDTAAAKAAPGVVDVLTGADLAGDRIGGLICGWMIHSRDGSPMKAGAHPAIALDRVRHVGDQVALVIAETKAQARDAAELVEVEYDVLPAVVDPSHAMDDGAPVIHDVAPKQPDLRLDLGDEAATDAAFAGAAHVVELDIINNRLSPNPMEPRAAIGSYDAAEERYDLYTTSQNPHVARLVLSAFVGIAPEHKLRVVAPDVGGGFGAKIYIYPEETACLWASRKIGGRPVKWTSDRTEAFLTDCHGRDHVTKAKLALDAEGRFLALRSDTIANIGAYMSTFSSATPTYLHGTLLSGQYVIPSIFTNVKAVYTNTVPVDAYRGAGRPEATYIIERLVETAARQLGQDPAELRRKNLIRSVPVPDARYHVLRRRRLRGSPRRRAEGGRLRRLPGPQGGGEGRGKLRGIGFSCYIEACGIAPSQAVGSLGAGVGLWESAEVRVNPVGTVEILTGSHSHGQGHETTFAQLVNERLGIGLNSINIVHGDTDKVQFGMGTYGSRSGAVGMSAIVKALDKVEAKAKKIAAHLMEAAEADIVIENGELKVAGTDKKLPFFQVALAAYTAHNLPAGMEPGLKESAFYDPSNFTFPSGTYIAEVEVDPDTGKTEIVQFVAADDFGNIINPMIVEGQVHGGLAQGIGQALLEGVSYDPESGQLLTGSYMDYAMPRADDLPSFVIAHTATPTPSNPLGMKGCGEAGAIGSPPALINAITDAIGNNHLSMPATPAKVWAAIHAAH